MLKSLVRSLLLRRGFELKPVGTPVRGPDNYIRHLRARGFRPGTVIDIGVATGTPWLYQFPEAKLVLVEPNHQFEADLQRIKARHHADIFPYAAGADVADLVLNVDLGTPSSSSLYAISDDLKAYWLTRGQTREHRPKSVTVKPLDAMLENHYSPPFLIKIDTEGFELEVLRGAVETLKKTAYLIVEASVARRHDGSYEFADLIAFLAAQGFRLVDIVDVAAFDGDGDISYMDIAFARTDEATSPQRSDQPDLTTAGCAAA